MLLCLFICVANTSCIAKPTNNQCLAVALYKECSGCSARGQKAVEEVIVNRSQINKKSVCEVVRSAAFPWSSAQKDWHPSKEMLDILFRTRMMEPVVGKSVYFFNNQPFTTFGKFAVRIESHFFYYKT